MVPIRDHRGHRLRPQVNGRLSNAQESQQFGSQRGSACAPFLKPVSTEAAEAVGSFELAVLATINKLRAEAWGSKIQASLSGQLDRDVAIGQLYLALARLERRGFISFKMKDPEPRKGGRSKKVFQLEAPGVRALERMAAVLHVVDASAIGSKSGEKLAT